MPNSPKMTTSSRNVGGAFQGLRISGPGSPNTASPTPSPATGGAGSTGSQSTTPVSSSFFFPNEPATIITLGEHFTVQASKATLKSGISASYWCPEMDLICDGKMVGVAVRYTGDDIVLMQFRQEKPSRGGKRYPFSISISSKYLVPVPTEMLRRYGSLSQFKGATYAKEGALPSEGIAMVEESCPFVGTPQSLAVTPVAASSPAGSLPSPMMSSPHMCVVCGVMNQPGEVRKHGWKCQRCVGHASSQRLRDECARIEVATTMSQQSSTPTCNHPPTGSASFTVALARGTSPVPGSISPVPPE